MKHEDCILFSGAATGAESAFGEVGERNSRNCATSRYTSLIRSRMDGTDGPATNGRPSLIPGSPTRISPEPELEYFSRTGRRRSTIFSIDPSSGSLLRIPLAGVY